MLGAFARLFVLGATVVTVFDGFHTHGGVTRYAHPVVLLAAWWVPLLFGSAVGFGGVLYVMGHRALFGETEPPSLARTAVGFMLFGAGYFASGYLRAGNVVKAVLLLALAAFLFAFLEGRPKALWLALAAAVTGPLVEVVLVHVGAFTHLGADFAGIPFWLAPLYLCAAPALGAVARRLLAGVRERRGSPHPG